MSGVDVDTRADVYALGVLLYELLTGTTPFDRDRFRRAAFDEIRRIIREEEPPRPSTRLSSLGPTLTDVSAQRGTDPGKLAGVVRGELDWIVMKCLEKDRNRRYETANGLARDSQRFLEGDAVEACPPTLGYRLRKFYRRNRAAVWIVGLFLGLTYVGASGIYFAYQRAVRAERRLGQERDAALVSESRAIAATREAEVERDHVARANASLRQLADRQRRTLYDSSMNLAQAAWDSGDAAKALELLRQWIPKPGEDDLRGFEWHYWNRQAHQERRTLQLSGLPADPQDWVSGNLSPDGSRIVALVGEPGGASRTLRLWDSETGRELWRVSAPSAFSSTGLSSYFSADGRRFMKFSHLGTSPDITELAVWETSTGRLVSSLSIPPNRNGFLGGCLSADGSLVAISGSGRDAPATTLVNEVWVVRVSDRKEIARFPFGAHRTFPPNDVTFSPDGLRIAVWEQPGAEPFIQLKAAPLVRPSEPQVARVRVLELNGARELWAARLSDVTWMTELRFTHDGQRLLVLCGNNREERLQVLDGGDGRVLQTIFVPEPDNRSTALCFSGHRFAIAKRKQAYVFDLDQADGAARAYRGHEYLLRNIAFRPDGSRLVSLDEGGVVKEWDLAGRAPGLKTPFVLMGSSSLLLTPDGARAVYVPTSEHQSPRRLRITDGTGRAPLEIGRELPDGHLHLLSISADSRNLACLWHSGESNYSLIVVDLIDGRERLRKVLGPGLWVGGAFAPDASRVVLLTDRVDTSAYPAPRREIHIFEVATGKELRAWKDPQAGTSFRGGCFSPDGRWLVIERFRGDDHRMVWLDAETLAERASIRIERPYAEAVFSRDGRQVAILQTASPSGGLVEVWAVALLLRGESPVPIFRATGLAGTLMIACEFSPDGRRLLTSSQGTIKLWDTSTGGEVLTLKVNATAQPHFNPDGLKIWAGLDEENQFWGWDATPIEEAKAP